MFVLYSVILFEFEKLNSDNPVLNFSPSENWFSISRSKLSIFIFEFKFFWSWLLDNSIIHHIYIPYYVGIIKDIHLDNRDDRILKLCEKYYNDFFKLCVQKEDETNYEHLCTINKNIDNIIGFSLLISYLEKEDIIDGFIEKVIDSYMYNIMDHSDIESYKLLVSFENISEIHFRIVPEKYKKILEDIREKTKSSKIRFKIMDILKV